MDEFHYKAPQYVDLSSPTASGLTQYGDDFFDVHQDAEIGYSEVVIKNETINSVSDTETLEATQISPATKGTDVQDSDASNFGEFRQALFNESISSPEVYATPVKLRRSMSVGAIEPLQEDHDMEKAICCAIQSLELSGKNGQSIFSRSVMEQVKASHSVGGLAREQRVSKAHSMSRDALNHTGGKLKRKAVLEEPQPRKYISLAEAVKKFQLGTPARFHSKAKHDTASALNRAHKIAITKAQSPALATKARVRAVNYLSYAEQEEKEVEAMRKNQLKANPINPNIMRAPVLNNKFDKRPSTRPEPFKLTETKYKPVYIPKEEPYQFHARPVPKTTVVPEIQPHARYSTIPKQNTPAAPKPKPKPKPKVPAPIECVEKKANVPEHDGLRKNTPLKSQKTRIEPFSFEERDRRMQQRKEEKIKKFLEEERKAHEFHARPISGAVSKSSQIGSKVSKMITEGTYPVKKDENSEPERAGPKPFKARPASVIHKKAFQPKRDVRPLIEVSGFTLNTERRASEREHFEKKLKDKQGDLEKCRKEYEENLKKLEMEETVRLRKETVHKANPIKAFKEFKIKPSTKEVTSPHSPNFSTSRNHTN